MMIFVGYFIFGSHFVDEDKTHELSLEKKMPSRQFTLPLETRKLISKHQAPLHKMRRPSNVVKAFSQSVLDHYSKNKIIFFKKPLFLIDGLYASVDEMDGQKLVTVLGGLFIYEGDVQGGLKVIYSSEKESYGIFTGEITVSGGGEKAREIVEKSSFEIVYKNDLSQKIIFKIHHLSDLSILDELNSISGIKISPDLKFSRLNKI